MKDKTITTTITRRKFLATTGAALVFPAILPSSTLGFGRKTSPSNRINVGVIGCGGQGNGDTESFLRLAECRVVAACFRDLELLLQPFLLHVLCIRVGIELLQHLADLID